MNMPGINGAAGTHTLGETRVARGPLSLQLINKPRQIAQAASISKTGRNTLRDQMNLTVDEFDEFVDLIDESTELNLDVSLPWKQQSSESKSAHIDWVAHEWGLARYYVGNWPIEAYTVKHGKLASRQASTAKDIPGGKKGSPQKKYRSTKLLPAKITRPKSRTTVYVGRRPPMLGRAPSRSLTPEPNSRNAIDNSMIVSLRRPSVDIDDDKSDQDPTLLSVPHEGDEYVRNFLSSLNPPLVAFLPCLVELGIYNEDRLLALATGPTSVASRFVDKLGADLFSTVVLRRGLLDLGRRMRS